MDVDDILGCILERIDSIVIVIHASTTCKRWRRIVSDPGFLRRFRARHAPTIAAGAGDSNHHPLPSFLLGRRHLRHVVDGPTFHSSSIDHYGFCPDFLFVPGTGADCRRRHQTWAIVDSRGSLLLIKCRTWNLHKNLSFPDLLVCEPFTRRCNRIPPPPPDLDVAAADFWGSYLADGDVDEAGGHIGMLNFRIVCRLYRDGLSLAAVFSTSGDDAGCGLGSWSVKAIDHHVVPSRPMDYQVLSLGTAGGSWYFLNIQERRLITFDGITGDFSSSILTAVEDWDLHARRPHKYFVTNGGDGKPRIFSLGGAAMKVFARRIDGQWALEKKKSGLLSEEVHGTWPGYKPEFLSGPFVLEKVGPGFVVLSPLLTQTPWPFSVDLQTMEVARGTKDMRTFAYQWELPWPPAFVACIEPSRDRYIIIRAYGNV